VVGSPFFVKKGPQFRADFIDRISIHETFDELSSSDKAIVTKAEESLKESVW
jgi:hypothetical protein